MPHLRITVPKPCHQSWAAMTPAAQGRHCAACATVVTDFTRMSDAEVVAYLGQPRGATCGRFRQDQLQRPLRPAASEPVAWRRWLAAAAAVLGLGAAAAPAAAQVQQKPAVEQRTLTMGMVAVPKLPQPLAPPPLVVRGVVLDSTSREPLPGATVLVKGTTIGVVTNDGGTFELQLPPLLLSQAAQLQVSSVGYNSQSFPLREAIKQPLVIVMAPDGKVLSGEVVIVGGSCAAPRYSPRGLWQRLTRPFRRW